MMRAKTTPHKPVIAIVGADRFLRAEAVQTMVAESDADGGLGPTRFDGQRATLAEVLDEVRTPSLLGGSRLVLVDDADELITRFREKLERYCAAPATGGTLVLLCDSLPKNQRIYKAIAASGEILTVEPLKGRALVGWVIDRAKEVYGKRLATDAADWLRSQVGDSPGTLNSELAKLATYVGDRGDIQRSDIEVLTDCHREEIIFAVVDALAEGRGADALAAWDQVLATDRAAPGRAIAGIAWALRTMLEARREVDAGGNVYAVAPRMRVDPVVLRKRLERFSTRHLERMQRDLLEIDLAIKTGEASIEAAIESWIVKHSGAPMLV